MADIKYWRLSAFDNEKKNGKKLETKKSLKHIRDDLNIVRRLKKFGFSVIYSSQKFSELLEEGEIVILEPPPPPPPVMNGDDDVIIIDCSPRKVSSFSLSMFYLCSVEFVRK